MYSKITNYTRSNYHIKLQLLRYIDNETKQKYVQQEKA